MKRINLVYTIVGLLFPFITNAQSIVINELSNGPSGAEEYVEFVVTGDIHCDTPPDSIDLRHWIFDDNNGHFATGSGTGIAQGACRFSDDDFWKAIPTGTLILIYNDEDKNSDIPEDDLSMDDGNCRLIIPITSTLIDRHEDLPSKDDASYATTGWQNQGDWQHVSMSNSNDSYQIRDINDVTGPVHSVSYANNSNNTIIYFSGDGGQTVFYFDNTVDDDPFNQNSWIKGSADDDDNDNGTYENGTNDQTPGRPNSIDNENWIISLNHNCTVPPTDIDAGDDQTICKGSSTTLSVSGGGASAVYTWSNGFTGTSQDVSPTETTTYIVTMTENGWCISDTVKVFVQEDLNVTILGEDTVCEGNSTTLNVTGAGSSATYDWSNGFTGDSQTVDILSDSTFTVVVTDNGCEAKDTIKIVVVDAINVNLTGDDAVCKGNSTTLEVTGGSASATYDWSNGFTGDSQTVDILSDSTFIVVVTDNGCEAKDTIEIEVIDVNVSVTGEDTVCKGNSITLTASGGGASAVYTWSNDFEGASQDVSPTETTSYTVTLTENTCSAEDVMEVTVIDLSVEITGETVICKGNSTTLEVTGGSASATYDWSNGFTGISQSVDILNDSTFLVLVTDKGCQTKDSIQVKSVSELSPNIMGDTLFCQDNTGLLETGNYKKYLWSTEDTTSSIEVFKEGYYSVTVSDKDGCEGKDSIWVNTPVSLDLDMSSITDDCDRAEKLTVIPQGGIAPYSYLWSDDETTSTTICLGSGTYTVTVTDSLGCIVEGVREIIIPDIELPELEIPTIFSPNGDDKNDTWRIKNIEFYGDRSLDIEIYDRWGNVIFAYSGTCENYANTLQQWDGTYNGDPINISSFVYIVAIEKESYEQGIVSIIR